METRLQPRQRTQGAFTIIELLVVIAIIAILAAILFPAFSAVREQARQSNTISNMHAVYVGAKLFNEDEGHFPSVLFGYAEAPDATLAGFNPPRPPQRPANDSDYGTPLNVTQMDKVKEFFATNLFSTYEGLNRGYLYPEQIKDYIIFTCPDNLVKDKQATTVVYYPLNSLYRPGQLVTWEAPDTGTCAKVGDRDLPSFSYAVPNNYPGLAKRYYKMDSMDIGPALNADGTIRYDVAHNIVYELHYSPDWSRRLGTACEPTDPTNNNKIDVTQLKYKNPPTDRTVLTYVTDHVATAGSAKVLVMLMNGTAKKMDVVTAARLLPLNYRP